ncbi:ANTAR domain-containing response regulator [Telluria aromaticivorans]|uniref:ANTAR domain-containing protein n=1 Tax=Telluria aromaticivorans TaxID=2725995 RepID=A0A7Y2K284_9BURK|nr:ANTAR domain-containing protein [Telluria aromaticivorans]NNG25307.1 ANTAR domain-containing protein [Telluria aromaticivorans]
MKSPGSTPSHLRIVVVNPVTAPATAPGGESGCEQDSALAELARRSAALRIGLLESGYDLVASLPADVFLPERIAQLQPDMIIVDSESDARDILEHIVIATRDERRPIVLFTEDDAPASMNAALDAGVSAYIVAGLHAGRVKSVLDVALARFRREQKLLGELLDTRKKLAERKVVDRAKGLVMTRYGLSEEQAYQRLRSMAMNKNMKLAEIAQRLIDVEDLLG